MEMVINSTIQFRDVYDQINKLKDAARKSGLPIVSDRDLDLNQPVVKVNVDRSKARDLGVDVARVGAACRRYCAAITSTAAISRGGHAGDPAGAPRHAADGSR